jgi:hypothetical protein
VLLVALDKHVIQALHPHNNPIPFWTNSSLVVHCTHHLGHSTEMSTSVDTEEEINRSFSFTFLVCQVQTFIRHSTSIFDDFSHYEKRQEEEGGDVKKNGAD